MSQAQMMLIKRLDILEKCSLTQAVTEGGPNDIERNDLASLFRNGLSVMAFAITEEFLRDRVAEVLRKFDARKIRLSDLSSTLQDIVTLEALKGLNFRAKFEDKNTRISWLLTHVSEIAKAKKSVSSLSKFSFGNSSSNIVDMDVTKILKGFGVVGGWTAIDNISKKIGCGGPVAQNDLFNSLSSRRHAAAHDVTAYISHTDLLEARKIILGTCVAFDLLLSHGVALHNDRAHPYTTNIQFPGSDIQLRRISFDGAAYVEQIELGANWATHAVYPTVKKAKSSAKTSAKANHQHVVVLDASGFPESWNSWLA